jgi:oligopeptide transport system substrate-binding protein
MEKEGFLPLSFSTEVRSLDPSIGIDDQSQIAIKMLFDGLMSFNPQGELTCAIAERYEISEDQKRYTFFLRSCNWSNGKEVTADDFVYSWKKIIGGNVKGSAVHNFYPIKNARAVLEKKKELEEVGIYAPDKKTLVVELEHPTPYFLEAISTSSFFAVNAELDQENPQWVNQVGSAFVCNGPFVLVEHKQNNELVLKKNPLYWDSQVVKLPGIKIAFVKEPLTQLNMFEKKEIAWAGKPLFKLPLDAVPTLKKTGQVISVPALGVYWYFLNTEAFPFNNKKMRQAFAYAIDRKAITDHVLQEGETPALGVLPKSLNVNPNPYFADNNIELAKKLFNEALQELGLTKETLPSITISYNSSEYHQRTALVIQEQWNKVFGIQIRLEQEEWKVHFQKLLSGDFQIGGMGWHSWLKDPMYIMQTFRYRSDGINMSRWEHPTYRALLKSAEQESDIQKRKRMFFEAEKLLMEEMPIIPIYFIAFSYAKSPGLKDVYVSEVNGVDFKWASYEKEAKR